MAEAEAAWREYLRLLEIYLFGPLKGRDKAETEAGEAFRVWARARNAYLMRGRE